MCRKVAEAADGGEIEIWGDGKQTRSFLYIDECVEGVRRLMESDFTGPVNIGSEEMVTINQLAEMVMEIAGKKLSHPAHPGPARRARPQFRQPPDSRTSRLGTVAPLARGNGKDVLLDLGAGGSGTQRSGGVGRTPWSAADALVGHPADL